MTNGSIQLFSKGKVFNATETCGVAKETREENSGTAVNPNDQKGH